MRAVVFKDFGSVEVAEAPPPTPVEAGDAILRVTAAAICGSDLHILAGRIPGMERGGILGHEFVGVVEEVGPGVTGVRPGDRAVASFIVPCGTCWFCRRRLFGRCPDLRVFGYGSFFGDLPGGQAERVRVPSADLCLHTVDPRLTDEQALLAGDIFTTAYEGAAAGQIEEGGSVAVLGCGPVGLLGVQCARLFKPAAIFAVDTVPARLEKARSYGAVPVDASATSAAVTVQEATGGRGADVVLECVGAPAAFESALELVRPGGRVVVIGVYSQPSFDLALAVVWLKGVEIRFVGTANVIATWDQSLRAIVEGTVDPAALISHRMKLEEAERAYQLFEQREALKVVLTP